jgi:hypothetical protein
VSDGSSEQEQVDSRCSKLRTPVRGLAHLPPYAGVGSSGRLETDDHSTQRML